tara:strand:+ start:6537 stop:6722 length:186 start_codon:yes stop_codon:yes gene_type:complete
MNNPINDEHIEASLKELEGFGLVESKNQEDGKLLWRLTGKGNELIDALLALRLMEGLDNKE